MSRWLTVVMISLIVLAVVVFSTVGLGSTLSALFAFAFVLSYLLQKFLHGWSYVLATLSVVIMAGSKYVDMQDTQGANWIFQALLFFEVNRSIFLLLLGISVVLSTGVLWMLWRKKISVLTFWMLQLSCILLLLVLTTSRMWVHWAP